MRKPVQSSTARLTLEQIHYLVPKEAREGKYLCPLCHQWHLSIDRRTAAFNCFTPGCDASDIAALVWSEVERRSKKPSRTQMPPSGPGLTRTQYADAKKLPADWLASFFLVADASYKGVPAITLPYVRDIGRRVVESGEIVWDALNVKWRWGMGARDRAWEAGAKACLYGEFQLLSLAATDREKPMDYCFIVEGESDTQTLAYNGFPVLGTPGTSWHKEWTESPLLASFLRGKTLLVIQEPGAAAEQLLQKIARDFPGQVRAVRLWTDAENDPKDASALWLKLWNEFSGFEGSVKEEFVKAIERAVEASIVVAPAESNAEQPTATLELVTASSVTPKLVRWLWPDRIPLNMLSVFFGMPDQGKSTVVIDIIARVTNGSSFPYCPVETVSSPAEVVVLAAEDDISTTYVPRLMAAGADRDKVHFVVSRLNPDGSKQPFALDTDLGALARVLQERRGVRLVVIDPLSGYLGGIDKNKDKEVRPLLQKIKEFTTDKGITIIGVAHFNKNADQASIHRLSGASAWGEVPRALWAFVPEPPPENPDEDRLHLMLNAKLNLTAASKREGLRYDFKGVSLVIEGENANIPMVEWKGTAKTTLSEVMTDDRKPGRKPEKTEGAMKWLSAYLADGPKPSGDKNDPEDGTVFGDGRVSGYSHNTLYEAKKRLGQKVRARQSTDGWVWELTA